MGGRLINLRETPPGTQVDPGDFIKVVIPCRKGDLEGDCEGIWLKVVSGDDRSGKGTIANDLVTCDWAKFGDKVRYETIAADRIPYVTALATDGELN